MISTIRQTMSVILCCLHPSSIRKRPNRQARNNRELEACKHCEGDCGTNTDYFRVSLAGGKLLQR